jgi:exosortase
VAAAAAGLVWVFWPTLAPLSERWWNDAEYSHGYLIPLFSLFLLWARRGSVAGVSFQFHWLGVPVLLAGLALRFLGIYLYFDWLAAVALLPCIAGLVLLYGGWPALRWAWPAVVFLVFMVPLPFRLAVALAHPLQSLCTQASTYALQTLGLPAFAEGNVIRLKGGPLRIVEACSGLSMLLIFFALSSALILLIRRPWYEKLIIFCSAIPIAVISNVTRITITGVLQETVGSQLAMRLFHDQPGLLPGLFMMLLALGLLWLELKVLSWVLPAAQPKAAAPAPLGVGIPGMRTGPAATPAASAPQATAEPRSGRVADKVQAGRD